MKNRITDKRNLSSIKIQGNNAFIGKHFLVLLNNTSEVEPIMEVSTALASKQSARIFARNFVVLPHLTPLSVGLRFAEAPSENLKIASNYHTENLPVDWLLLLTHNPRVAILNTVRKKKIDCVIGGFQGCIDIYKNLRNALSKIPTDILIIRSLLNKKISEYSRILVPFLKGAHTPLAVDIAGDLANTFGQKLAILYEYESQINEGPREQDLKRLKTKQDLLNVERITAERNSIISSISKELNENTWLVLPAYRPSRLAGFRLRYKQRSLLKEIIQSSYVPLMIVKKHERRTGFLQKILKREWN